MQPASCTFIHESLLRPSSFLHLLHLELILVKEEGEIGKLNPPFVGLASKRNASCYSYENATEMNVGRTYFNQLQPHFCIIHLTTDGRTDGQTDRQTDKQTDDFL